MHDNYCIEMLVVAPFRTRLVSRRNVTFIAICQTLAGVPAGRYLCSKPLPPIPPGGLMSDCLFQISFLRNAFPDPFPHTILQRWPLYEALSWLGDFFTLSCQLSYKYLN